MSRALRKAAPLKLPDGVKWATQVPMLIIPSGGHSAKVDGSDGGLRRRPTGNTEVDVRVRYPPCCDTHKGGIKVESLATSQDIASMCSRFSQHLGHGQLMPSRARIEWIPCNEQMPCDDCMTAYEEKANK